MKRFIVLALVVASACAFDLRGRQIEQRTRSVPEGRITNGEEAEPEQFPYQVGLSLYQSLLQQSWCGGSLLNNEWVLTAAHCTEDQIKVTVYLGGTERSNAEVKYTVYADDIIIHSEWDLKTISNDISLIKIPFTEFTPRIQPVKLPAAGSSYSSYTGDGAVASGWGKTSDDKKEKTPKTLQYAEMEVISNRACRKTFRFSIKPSHICVATPDATSICSGDSGGPLVLESSGVQIGLSSFVHKDGCTEGHPAVFTRITSFLDWIEENTGDSF